jgi:subtilase family serine protease
MRSARDGSGETTYPAGPAQITAQNAAELTAAANGVPVLVSTGDCGVVQNLAVANGQCAKTTTPDTAAWDDSPWVTAVGGSVPNLGPTTGQRLGPDPVWHVNGTLAEGAGFSSVFPRPSYQNGVAGITRSPMRSVPDITLDAQDGTSESAPLMAGVLALATQVNQANVGPINPLLYRVLGPAGAQAGLADVVHGNNSVTTPGTTIVHFPPDRKYRPISRPRPSPDENARGTAGSASGLSWFTEPFRVRRKADLGDPRCWPDGG